jgi:hypothetical protein
VVFQVTEYGEEVSSVPKLAPSSKNCTPETPTASEAVADTVTEEPETVAPLAGAVTETVGAVVSPPVPPVPPPEEATLKLIARLEALEFPLLSEHLT